MPNDTRSGLKISGNRSDGGMDPPQSPDLNIIEGSSKQKTKQKAANIQERKTATLIQKFQADI